MSPGVTSACDREQAVLVEQREALTRLLDKATDGFCAVEVAAAGETARRGCLAFVAMGPCELVMFGRCDCLSLRGVRALCVNAPLRAYRVGVLLWSFLSHLFLTCRRRHMRGERSILSRTPALLQVPPCICRCALTLVVGASTACEAWVRLFWGQEAMKANR